jgi:hypothetical protein
LAPLQQDAPKRRFPYALRAASTVGSHFPVLPSTRPALAAEPPSLVRVSTPLLTPYSGRRHCIVNRMFCPALTRCSVANLQELARRANVSHLRLSLRRSPLRRNTKPTGRTFDLQDYRVRAAVRQALKNVACASSARSRGSAGPIRAKPLYCQFDLPGRRRPIGSYEVFFVLCHLVSDNLNICRASRR